MSTDPLQGIPPHLHGEVRQFWSADVAGGSATYATTGSRVGVVGQWSRILGNGRDVYFRRPVV